MILETYTNNRNHIYNSEGLVWSILGERYLYKNINYYLREYNIDSIEDGYNYLCWLVINASLTPLYDNSRVIKEIDALQHVLPLHDSVL